MSDLDIRFDQVRRRRFDAQTGKDREAEHRRERALARRTAVAPAKLKRRAEMLAAFARTARAADRHRAAQRRGWLW